MIAPEKMVSALKEMGIRFYDHVVVSPFSMKDSPDKCAMINLLIEKRGYRLADERGYPKKPEPVEGP